MISNLKNLIQSYRMENSFFGDLEIACSFDPLHQVFFEKDLEPMDVLQYIVNELKISNIRIAIRWSKAWSNSTLDLSFYKPYLDYCLEHGVDIVFNVGPLKVMRWPEEHIPYDYKGILNKYDTINLDHPIVEQSLIYLEELLKELKNNYSNNIIAIQGDNELFNSFGEYSLKITKEYELKVIETINKYFDCPIYINSSGVNDFKKIFKLVNEVNNKIILGVNYYYKTKYQHRIPFLNKLDNLILKKAFSISSDTFKKIADENNYQVEVSELQGEPWWPNAKSPGNNYNEFVFTLLRTKYLKPSNQQTIVARYWGIEDLVSKFLDGTSNPEHQKIKDLILQIQV